MFNLEARIKLSDKMSGPLKTVTSAVKAMDRAMASTDNSVSSVTRSMTKSAATTRLIASGTDKASRSVRGLVKENDSLARSYKRANSSGGSGGGGFGLSSLNPIGAATKIATAGFAAMAVAATAASYAVFKISANALKLSSDAEQAQIAFTTMLGGADKSKAFLNELTDFANRSPFELPGLRDSAKRMLAFGFSADKVIPTLTGLGNAAAGLGLGDEGVDRLTLALGQMKAKAKVSGDEMMQITEAGIPAWDILAKKMGVSTAAVMKLSEKGLIPADAAINALIDGMNERFPNMMDAQSKSLAGLWSTIKDTFNNKILVKWGDGIRLGIQPKLTQFTNWLNNNGDTIQRWGDKLQSISSSAATALGNTLSTAFQRIKTQYLDNPEFQKLSFTGKVGYVFNDIETAFDTWWTASGKSAFETKSQEITTALLKVLNDSGPVITDIGTKLGTGLASGMWQAFQDQFVVKWEKPDWLSGKGGVRNFLFGDGLFGVDKDESGGDSGKKTPTKRSSGLGFVPRDNMPVLVHRGERIQTKTEADADRSGRGKGGVVVNIQTMNVRKEADIDDIAKKLVRLIEQYEGAASVG